MPDTGQTAGSDSNVTRALEEGARASREAAASPTRLPPHLVVWQRHRWKIIAAVILVVTEFVLFTLGSVHW